MSVQPALELRGIRKTFPGVVAVDGVDLTLYPGTIHALVGENGAGKSTLAAIAFGEMHPDRGTVVANGTVGLVHQQRPVFSRHGAGISPAGPGRGTPTASSSTALNYPS